MVRIQAAAVAVPIWGLMKALKNSSAITTEMVSAADVLNITAR